ncbi:LysR family transcriptional regulator [Virgibacillus soli]|uniref:LysR substrate-binding domain-containing protein n=1 Tax=Paracerasibacillus soli TaxID=480284 RepID=A0ABU5CNJ5_9BACI|nr:LysR substrate-binding domain-containing protein [Virgibacillus soli]MDY0407932.1 LysR substrate-binding domain-containing protein [Virgibacillus soli]
MEIRQLECFLEVCKELHFTRAAENLNISQPSLSQQIKNLEFEVGVPLFDRIGKRTALTEAGKILRHHSQRIFFELEQARSALQDLNGLQRGKLTIGSLLTTTHYLLPQVIFNFKKMYPNIALTVLGMRTGKIKKEILENNLDLGITFLPIENDELETISLFTEELALALPINHSLTNVEEIEWKVIEQIQTVLLPENYYLRMLIQSYCNEAGVYLKPTLEMTTLESIVQMVSEGIGATILPVPYLDFINNDKIVTVKLVNPTPMRQIGLLYRKDKYMCTATQIFINQLVDISKSLNIYKQEAK